MITILLVNPSFAQSQNTRNPQDAIFVELLGLAGGASINIEQQVLENVKVRYGVGVGYYFGPTLPIAISYTKRAKHGLVTSLGITPYSKRGFTGSINGKSINDKSINGIYLSGLIGYRFTPANEKMFFQAGVCTLQDKNRPIPILPFISFGLFI